MPLDAPKIPTREHVREPQQHPATWIETQRALAANTNLALVTIGASNLLPAAANETSICRAFLAHPEKSQLCAEYCGRARELALRAGGKISYTCHAGLRCFAVPVGQDNGVGPMVVIGGRAFTAVREYRAFQEREKTQGNASEAVLCRNLKFASEEELNQAAQLVVSRAREFFAPAMRRDNRAFFAPERTETPFLQLVTNSESGTGQAASVTHLEPRVPLAEPKTVEAFFNLPFDKGCCEALRMIGARFGLRSMALLMRRGEKLISFVASGPRRQRLINAAVNPDDTLFARLQAQTRKTKSVLLNDQEIAFLLDDEDLPVAEIGVAFPLFVGEALQGALLVFDEYPPAEARWQIQDFAQTVVVPLEMARLRAELKERAQAGAELRDFASHLATLSEPAEIYAKILQKAVEALGAKRASVLSFDENLQLLTFRESIGISDNIVRSERIRPGEGIAGMVFERGEPLLVRDVRQLDASSETQWIVDRVRDPRADNSETRSFISFPIQIGAHRIGVLNLAGDNYGPGDLKWLRSVIPHAAAALDRIHLREQAERYQLMSITDPLTGLVNRRYLEERFAEELKRSQRYYYPLSVLMIDIDNFKSYNDSFGHQAGDDVLRTIAHSIRASLRNFDVAARYGGEEFCVILPETDEAAAAGLAERLRAQVEKDFGKTNTAMHRPVTISVGVASLGIGLQTAAKIVLAADQALYAAKGRGRNCVVVGRKSVD
ncbi:MAG: diguanylate cyclase [Blastocatellia bacterium]